MRAVIAIGLLLFSQAFAKVDDSIEIFFPKSLKYLMYSQSEFPAFWWNFLVFEPKADGSPQFEKAQEICTKLQPLVGGEIKYIMCGDKLASFVPTLKQWADDLSFREPAPSLKELHDKLIGSLNEIGFLSSVNPDLFQLKRSDPLDQWQVYLQKSQSIASSTFKRQKGYLIDEKTQRLIIPIQFSLKPQMKNVEKTEDILLPYRPGGVVLVGAHASSYTNEKQVHADLGIVSVVGIIVLICFISFLVLKGRVAALLLFPPVAISLSLAAWIVEQIDGSIHGLTLAFGSGIVGLAVDYGLHGAFNAESKQTWKSNLIGFLTTFTALAVMLASGIPLIRQMMLFAVFGLIFGFIFFFFLCKYLPRFFTMKSIHLPRWNFKGNMIIVILLMLLGGISFFQAHLSFDLRKMNYQLPDERRSTDWFFTQNGNREDFLLLRDRKDIGPHLAEEVKWARENKIDYVGLGDYWPANEDEQAKNLKSWSDVCLGLKKQTSADEKKIFAPFFENTCAENRKPLSFDQLSLREYSNHLVGNEGFLSILISESQEQGQKIREKFSNAKSLTESVKGFSNSLEKDLHWMIPAAFLLSTLILFIYYRTWICVLTSYIPFFTGLGLFYAVNLTRGGEIDLISVLGLLMVFGFSLDYGVFATDIYQFPQVGNNEDRVYSALGLAAISNIIGFFPMVFAKHPVLHELGLALFCGTVGTYLGTIWGVEKVYRWRKPK
jgi:hypothetical protein